MPTSYFITGANRGLGLEFVLQLSQDENNVVFGTARSLKNATELNKLVKSRPNVHAFEADITDAPALKAAAADVAKITGGGLDILINNAAYVDHDRSHLDISEYTEEFIAKDFDGAFHVNVTGIVLTTNILLPLLRKGTKKQVVNVTSALGDIPLVKTTDIDIIVPYSISKTALNMANEKYANSKLRDEGFTFVLLSPGIVDTSLEPPSRNAREGAIKLGGKVAKLYPNWKGPVTTAESIRLIIDNVISKLTQETHNGAFVSQHGNQEWL